MLCFGILSPCALLTLIVPKFYSTAFLRTVGITFWCCFLAEMLCLWLCCRFREKDISEKETKQKKKTKRLPGVISFFRNRLAKVIDCLLLPLTAWVLIAFFADIRIRWLDLISVVICLICYQLHSILNGKNYEALKKLKS